MDARRADAGELHRQRRGHIGRATGQLVLEVYLLAVRDFALVDPEREATVGIHTHPRFEQDRSPLLSVIGQRDQKPLVTLEALRPVHRLLLVPVATPISSGFPTAR